MDDSSIVSRTDEWDTAVHPRISLIAPPPYENGKFMIGIGFDIGDLGFGDWDEIEELARQLTMPEGFAEFISAFTGIPIDMMDIGFSVALFAHPPEGYFPNGRDYVPSGICPVWGDYRGIVNINEIIESDLADLDIAEPRSVDFRMGNLIVVEGWQPSTAGHPLASNGISFITSVHCTSALRRVVTRPGSSIIEGTVARAIFNNVVDITQVNFIMSNRMSAQLPWGGSISNFRGNPQNNDPTRSIRGISGVHSARIINANATIPGTGLSNRILTYPRGNATFGDSGAALIHATLNSVLGTYNGTVFHNGQWFAFYTNVQFY